MKLKKFTCENCGGSLKVNSLSHIKNQEVNCQYCGAVYILNAKYSKLGAKLEVELDRIREAEQKDATKAEWEFKDKQEERKLNTKILLGLAIFIGISMLALSVGAYFESNPMGVKITVDQSDFKGENYKIVKEKLTDMGFKNINTEKVADLKFGILSSEGDVKEVTINGDNDFKKDDYFDEQSIIKIYYHVFDK
ncbi:hypothetical protein ABHA52_13530 [Enterococcus faecium]|uniref:hypothetical protein n=1 Tax=Enterococcus TaxID=1350 RepID=UPI00064C9C3F|nr:MULTISPECIES: hypothetical protein [Enterococcus]EGO9940321.1 hypothetical protein [Enterococcus faecium]MCA6733682.1 hypothetical protein [Enterococcus lactis]MCA6736203.1 hypothetical protein [Enterococcus lactis]MCA6738749.1 hypothetical protein [Enterococcus lactis]MCA6754333.1 hypothetical protein [Enterococcus lactis]